MVAVKNGKVVATHGDMQAEVNVASSCVKGYFLSKIMYGADRLTTPLLRMRNGHSQGGEFQPVSWDRRSTSWPSSGAGAEGEGPDPAVGMFGRPVDDLEGYAATKLMRARLPLQQSGSQRPPLRLGGRHLHPCLRHGRAVGCYDDFEHADAFVLWGSNMAEIRRSWVRVTDRRLSAPSSGSWCSAPTSTAARTLPTSR